MDPISAVGIAAASIQFFDFLRTLLKDYGDFRHNRSPLTIANFHRSATRLRSLANDVNLLSQEQSVSNKLIVRHDQTQLVLRLLGRLEAKLDEHHSTQNTHLERLEANDNKIMEVIAFTQQTLLDKSEISKTEVATVLVTLANGETRAIAEKMQGTPLRRGYDETMGGDGAVSHSEQMLTLRAPTSSNKHQASIQDPASIHSAILKCLWFRHVSDRFEMAKNRHSETFNWIWHSSPDPEHKWSNFSEFLTSNEQIYWVNGKPGSGKTTFMKFICKAPELDSCLHTWAGNSNFVVASFFFWNLGPIALQKSQEGLLRSILYDVLRKAHALLPAVVSELYFEFLRSRSSDIAEPTLPELVTWFRRLIRHTTAQFRLCLIIDGLDEYTGSYVDLIDLLITETSASPFIKLVVSSRPIPACVESFQNFPGLRLQDLTYGDIHSYVEDTLGRRLVDQGYEESAEYVQLLNKVSEKSSGVFLWVVLVVLSLIEGMMNGDNPRELRQRLEQLPPDLEDLYRQMLEKIPTHYRQQASNIFSMILQALEYESCRNHAYPVPALQVAFAEEDQQENLHGPVQELTADVRKRKCADVERRIRSRCCGLLEVNDRTIEDHVGWEYFRDQRKVLALTERKGDALYETYPYDSSFAERVERQIPPQRPRTAPCVEFIHRSAVEFFRTAIGASFLQEIQSPGHFEPRRVLLRSQIRFLTSVGSSYILDDDMKAGNYLITLVSNFIQDVADAEQAGEPFSSELLYSANAVIDHHWNTASSFVFPASAKDVSYNSGSFPFVTRVSRIKGHWSRLLFLRKTTAFGINTRLFDELGSLGFVGLASLIPYPSYVNSRIQPKSGPQGGSQLATKLLNTWVRAKVEFQANNMAIKSLASDDLTYLASHAFATAQRDAADDSLLDLYQETPEYTNAGPWGDQNLQLQQYRDWGLSEISEGPYLRENSELLLLLLQEGADPNYSPADNIPTTWGYKSKANGQRSSTSSMSRLFSKAKSVFN
ncbi:hypothetical protein G7Z17_g4119 [Cylindrodendrum hubeiense]|uniref:NACHT domain-containing protein n=1 Tax=Cylindrodendrum hubeiense TaxID=595255 RepID=A0A9P5LCY0_9HYPO|nr:hypothetical protein G7Z17_g4119 [Cylindrodendrum hubeiense]